MTEFTEVILDSLTGKSVVRALTEIEISEILEKRRLSSVASIPEKVSRFQARAALYQMGLLEAAEALTTMAGGLTEIAWSDATEFYRDSPSIAGLAPHLNLTEEQIDDLFRLANTIRA